MQTPILEARALSYAIGGQRVLGNVSFALARGEMLALVGPNGAGKSTLLQLLAGDQLPIAGEVLLGGRPVADYSLGELARTRAVLPQQTLLQFAFRAEEVVLMGRNPYLKEAAPQTDQRIVMETMCQTETSHLAQRCYPDLSGGEQTLISLARVLVQQTSLLFLDEPTAALDIHHQELVMSIAQNLVRQHIAVLAVLHDLNLAARYADRVVLLARGRVLATGTPREVFTESLLTQAFEHPVRVVTHPFYHCPLITPMPCHRPLQVFSREPMRCPVCMAETESAPLQQG